MQKIAIGNEVEWKWGRGNGEGRVKQKFAHDVERTIKGTTVKRRADEREPAFLVEQKDGNHVLKSRSELRKTDD